MSNPVEVKFWDAARGSRVSEVSSLLRDHPGINVNWTNEDGWTALHTALLEGHVEVAKLLLAHPKIEVNLKSDDGQTPILRGCWNGQMSVVQVLLKDPRVDVTLDDDRERTPLWFASRDDQHEVIEWLIASGRDLGDVKNKKGNEWGKDKVFTALEIARKCKRTEIVSVLERFLANPALTRHELRVKLGVLDVLAAEVFALTVFLCDDLLHLKPVPHPAATPNPAAAAATRFFAIASKLPMELQMILCHRAYGSMKQNILRKDSEAAFKSLTSFYSFSSKLSFTLLLNDSKKREVNRRHLSNPKTLEKVFEEFELPKLKKIWQ